METISILIVFIILGVSRRRLHKARYPDHDNPWYWWIYLIFFMIIIFVYELAQ